MSHEEYNAATGWVQLPDMIFETLVDMRITTMDGGMHSNPMWANVGGSLEPTGEIILTTESWNSLIQDSSALFGQPGHDPVDGMQKVAGVDMTSNWALQSHWQPIAGNYHDFYEGAVSGFSLVDYDPEAWRFDTALALADEFADVNPDVDFYEVEWENYDVREPDGPFGTHSNRRLITDRTGWEGQQWQVILVDDQLELVEQDVLQPDIVLYGPEWLTGVPGGFESTPLTSNNLLNRKWTIPGARQGTFIGDFEAGPAEVTISDEVFNSNALLVSDSDNGHGNPIITRGFPVWAIADFEDVLDAERIYDATTRGRIRVFSTFTPPRIRITYIRDTPPFRRIYPTRGDALAGGARQVYPPPKAMQSGNRTAGGYW